jgi:hypothetical protein
MGEGDGGHSEIEGPKIMTSHLCHTFTWSGLSGVLAALDSGP